MSRQLAAELRHAGVKTDSAARVAKLLEDEDIEWTVLEDSYRRGGEAAVRSDLDIEGVANGVKSKIITYLHTSSGASSSGSLPASASASASGATSPAPQPPMPRPATNLTIYPRVMFGAFRALDRIVLNVNVYDSVGDVVSSLHDQVMHAIGHDLGSTSLVDLQCRVMTYNSVEEITVQGIAVQLSNQVGEIPNHYWVIKYAKPTDSAPTVSEAN